MKRFNREVVRRDCLVCVGIDCGDPVKSDPLPSLFDVRTFDVSWVSCTGDVNASSKSIKPLTTKQKKNGE